MVPCVVCNMVPCESEKPFSCIEAGAEKHLALSVDVTKNVKSKMTQCVVVMFNGGTIFLFYALVEKVSSSPL